MLGNNQLIMLLLLHATLMSNMKHYITRLALQWQMFVNVFDMWTCRSPLRLVTALNETFQENLLM